MSVPCRSQADVNEVVDDVLSACSKRQRQVIGKVVPPPNGRLAG